MHKLFRIQSNMESNEIVNQKPSFPQHNQISQTIFLCVNKHHKATSDNKSHSNREIIDISDDEEEEDENTCKNGTSIDDSSDDGEIEVIQLSDDDEVNDESSGENMTAIFNKHDKITKFLNACKESSLDLPHKSAQPPTNFDHHPSNPSTSQTVVNHQPLICPLEDEDNPNGTFSRNHVLLTLGLTCSECSVLMDSRLKLEQHLLDEHGKLPFKCMIRGCNLQFMERSQLDKHYLNHQFHIAYINPSTKWTCSVPNCRSALSVKTSFMTHVHLYHEAGLFQCAICLEQFSHRFLVYNHYKAKHRYTQERGNIRFRCIWPNCGGGRIFNYFSNAIAHVRTVHLNVPIVQEDAFHRIVKSYRVPSEFVQKIQIINHAQESRIYHREIA